MAWETRSEDEIALNARQGRLMDLETITTVDKKGNVLKKVTKVYDDKGHLDKTTTVYFEVPKRKIIKMVKGLLGKNPVKITELTPTKVIIEDAGGGIIDEKVFDNPAA